MKNELVVKIQVMAPGCMPRKAHPGDSCFDVMAAQFAHVAPGETVKIPLGFKMEIPEGWEAQLRPRSGLASKGILCSLGTIDEGYRGELAAIIINTREAVDYEDRGFLFVAGDRVAQMTFAPVPKAVFELVDEVSSNTDRGSGGFGSTGVASAVTVATGKDCPTPGDLNTGTDA